MVFTDETTQCRNSEDSERVLGFLTESVFGNSCNENSHVFHAIDIGLIGLYHIVEIFRRH